MKVRLFLRKNSIATATMAMIILAGCSALLLFYNRYQIGHFKTVEKQVTEAKYRIEKAKANIHVMDMGLRGYMLVPKDQMLYPYRLGQEAIQPNLDTLGMILQSQQYPDMEAHERTKMMIREYQDLLEGMVQSVSQNRADEALKILESDPGYEVFMVYDEHLTKASAFEDQLYEKAQEKYQEAEAFSFATQMLFIALVIPTLFFVMYQINKASRRRAQLFEELEKSRRNYLFDAQTEQNEQDERTVINELIENLRCASHFIGKIAQGDYSATWEGLNDDNQEANQENLAGALIHMREQMKRMKQEDQERMWSTEGFSKVAEIARVHQEDVTQLAEQLLAYLITYTEANQGSLFFLQEDELGEPVLTQVACYAYDKKKYAEKTIKIGQGLVGQTYLEKKTKHIENVPNQYIQITSGLGEATPGTLLLVPLIMNGQVMGVLEMAAFYSFAPYQVAFLENAGEIIASTVASIKINTQTKWLLEQSQEGAETLRAQEEEMRQNMEELQATQEEMERKAQEYEAVIDEQKDRIQQLEQISG